VPDGDVAGADGGVGFERNADEAELQQAGPTRPAPRGQSGTGGRRRLKEVVGGREGVVHDLSPGNGLSGKAILPTRRLRSRDR
jgi:hypothetical protein